MTDKVDKTSELLQAVLAASDDRKDQALRVVRGEFTETTVKPVVGPLLLGMGAAARFLGVSRSTLWRVLQAGTINRVELFAGSFRVRRADLEALAAGEFGFSVKSSRRGRPAKARNQESEDVSQHGPPTSLEWANLEAAEA